MTGISNGKWNGTFNVSTSPIPYLFNSHSIHFDRGILYSSICLTKAKTKNRRMDSEGKGPTETSQGEQATSKSITISVAFQARHFTGRERNCWSQWQGEVANKGNDCFDDWANGKDWLLQTGAIRRCPPLAHHWPWVTHQCKKKMMYRYACRSVLSICPFFASTHLVTNGHYAGHFDAFMSDEQLISVCCQKKRILFQLPWIQVRTGTTTVNWLKIFHYDH